MEFDNLKKYYIERLRTAIEKGEVDEPILNLLKIINKLNDYFTTSSCAGRIVLMKIPKSGKKNEAEFLFKSHYTVNPEEVWRKLLEVYNNYEDSIWLKQEPFILHISARTLDHAVRMLELAQKVGLKHSGIISIKPERIVIEIQSTERVEAIVTKNKKLLVSEDYFYVLINEANKKLEKTRKKMDKFYEEILLLSENIVE